MPLRLALFAALALTACTSSTSPAPPSGDPSPTKSSSDGTTAAGGDAGTSRPETTADAVYEAPSGQPCVDTGSYHFEGAVDPPDGKCFTAQAIVGVYTGMDAYPVGATDLEPKTCDGYKAPATCALEGTRCNWTRAEHLPQDSGGFGDLTITTKVTSHTSVVISGSEEHRDASGNLVGSRCTWKVTGTKR